MSLNSPPAVTIRFAEPRERDDLVALQWRASLANERDRDILLAHPDAIDLPIEQISFRRVYVAELDGTVAGFAVVLPRDDGDAELDGLFVEPDRWQAGVGAAMVEHGCQIAAEFGAQYLHVIGNPHAKGFYEKCGFNLVGDFETRFGPGILMRRAICAD